MSSRSSFESSDRRLHNSKTHSLQLVGPSVDYEAMDTAVY